MPSTTKPKPDRTAEMEGMIRNDGIKLVGLLMIKEVLKTIKHFLSLSLSIYWILLNPMFVFLRY